MYNSIHVHVHESMDRTIFLDLHKCMRKGREGKGTERNIIPTYVVYETIEPLLVFLGHIILFLHVLVCISYHTPEGEICSVTGS